MQEPLKTAAAAQKITPPKDARLRMSLTEAAAALEQGEVSSKELAELHLARIDELQPKLNAFSRVFHERAVQDAEESDARRQKGELRGKYDGVPISLKENIEMAGIEATIGLKSRVGVLADQDAPIVTLVKKSGAIILGKTNLSQLMIFNESRNPVHGQTQNPYDTSRTPGGSSGGEAAAIASFQSCGGIGSDIGGSIRIPAAYCGITGLLPTTNRFPNRGMVAGIAGQEGIRGQCGPMARKVADLRAFFDIIPARHAAILDPAVVPMAAPNLDALEMKGLRIGIFSQDDVLEVSSSSKRALRKVATRLQDMGCEVSEFQPPCTREMIFTYIGLLSADGAKSMGELVDYDGLDPALQTLWKLARMPKRLRKVAAKGARLVDRNVAELLDVLGEKSVQEMWALVARTRTLSRQVFDAWNAQKLDVIVAPVHASPAIPHGMSREYTLGGAFAFHFNFLHCPSGSLPVTTVQPGEDVRFKVKGKLEKIAAECELGSVGMPVGLQFAARPYREDIVLKVMQELETNMADDDDMPHLASW
ncbi:MAG: amidase [Deltaproteobacteria bacterium]|nr:amidase [Deltaproteobacteria bacterium]